MKRRNIRLMLALLVAPVWLYSQSSDSLQSKVFGWDSLVTSIDKDCVRKQITEGQTRLLAHFYAAAITLQPGTEWLASPVPSGEEILVIVKEGKLAFKLGSSTTRLGPGSVGYFLPGNAPRLINRTLEQVSFYVFRFRSRSIPESSPVAGSRLVDWDTVRVQPTEKGQRRQILDGPTALLRKMEMHTTALRSGLDSHAPHTHREEEIILVLTGNVTMNINGEWIPATAGDVIFLASGIPHALRNSGSERCEYFAFQWRD